MEDGNVFILLRMLVSSPLILMPSSLLRLNKRKNCSSKPLSIERQSFIVRIENIFVRTVIPAASTPLATGFAVLTLWFVAYYIIHNI